MVGGIEQRTREKNDCRRDDYVSLGHSASPVHRNDATKLNVGPWARSVARHVGGSFVEMHFFVTANTLSDGVNRAGLSRLRKGAS